MTMDMRVRILGILLGLGSTTVGAQESSFHVQLRLDYLSARQMLAFFDGSGRAGDVAGLRGSQLALTTGAALARQTIPVEALAQMLDGVRSHRGQAGDILQLAGAYRNRKQISALLDEIQRQDFAGTVAATVEQLFPGGTSITTSIPVYFVGFGSPNIDAYERRVSWNGDTPIAATEPAGEPVIVVNLGQTVVYGRSPQEQLRSTVGVVAHEVFHAVIDAYKERSGAWRSFHAQHRREFDQLLELAHNEGIAYYLTLIQNSRGYLREDWVPKVRQAFIDFNAYGRELISPATPTQRKADLMRMANTSEYWNNYGAITGMIIARSIDQKLGRDALRETIALGPYDFFLKYFELARNNPEFPPPGPDVLHYFGR